MLFFSGKKNSSSLNQHFKKKKEGKKASERVKHHVGRRRRKLAEQQQQQQQQQPSSTTTRGGASFLLPRLVFFGCFNARFLLFVLFEREERSRKFPHEQEGRRERWMRARPSLSLSFSLSRGALFVFVRAALFVV